MIATPDDSYYILHTYFYYLVDLLAVHDAYVCMYQYQSIQLAKYKLLEYYIATYYYHTSTSQYIMYWLQEVKKQYITYNYYDDYDHVIHVTVTLLVLVTITITITYITVTITSISFTSTSSTQL